jgi:hypothetical protein
MWGRSAAQAACTSCGLTASTTTSASAIDAVGAGRVVMAKSRSSSARRASLISIAVISPRVAPARSSPAINAVAMLPPPMKQTFAFALTG